MPRNGHLPGFDGVFELAVAPFRRVEQPAVSADDAYGFSYFGHGLVGSFAFMGHCDYNMEDWGRNGRALAHPHPSPLPRGEGICRADLLLALPPKRLAPSLPGRGPG